MEEPYAFIILNRPISFEAHDFQRLWNKGLTKQYCCIQCDTLESFFFGGGNSISAAIRVLVDGGSNQWFEYIDEHKLGDSIETPHFLTGDMDSISKESSERIKAMNCQRIPTPDQMDTDCTKSLIAIQSYLEPKKVYLFI